MTSAANLVDTASPGRVLVFGSPPGPGRDLDLLIRTAELTPVAEALAAAGFRSRNDEWVRFRESTAEAVDLVPAARRAGGWQLDGGYEDWDLWLALAERGRRGVHVPVLTGYYRVRSTRMLAATTSRHGERLALLRERHPRLFAERSSNRGRSPAPLRCKLLFPLVDALPMDDYAKLRVYRVVNRPGALLARL
jgi:hypothetical protein